MADGVVTSKEGVWLTAAWAAFVSEVAYDLFDPFSPVDARQAEALMREAYAPLAALVDSVPMPWGSRAVWAALRPMVPTTFPHLVTHLASVLDAGETHD